MTRFKIGSTSLSWWANFNRSIMKNEYDKWIEARDRALSKENAMLVFEHGYPYLEFENDYDATLFLLKWS